MGGRCAVAAAVTVWGALLLGARPGAVPLGNGGALAPPALLRFVVAFAWRAPPRVGTVLALAALTLAGLARGGASARVLERGVAALPEDATPRWIRARVIEHPLREGGTPLATVRLLSP